MAADNRSLMDLPKLGLENILLRLPLSSLLVCCCVSKSMLNFIKNDSDFARAHCAKSEPQLMIQPLFLSRFHMIDLGADITSLVQIKPSYNLPLPDFKITLSCNGLLLLENLNMLNDFHHCIVSNPVTGDYTILPETVCSCRNVTCAFYYCHMTKQFKVMRVFNRPSPDSDAIPNSFVELDSALDPELDSYTSSELDLVSDHDSNINLDINSEGSDLYSSADSGSDSDSDSDSDSVPLYPESGSVGELLVGGSDSWESLGSSPFSSITIHSACQLDNATHWLCSDVRVRNLIIFFDFVSHQFGDIPAPDHMEWAHANAFDHVTLIVLGKCLSIFDSFTTEAKFDVWKMKEYGVVDSWTREFVIDTTEWGAYNLYHHFTPVICRNNGAVVMVSEEGYLIFYDLLEKTGRVFDHPPLRSPWNVVVHTPSFMSLRDVARGSNLEVLNVRLRFVDPVLDRLNYMQLSATSLSRQIANY